MKNVIEISKQTNKKKPTEMPELDSYKKVWIFGPKYYILIYCLYLTICNTFCSGEMEETVTGEKFSKRVLKSCSSEFTVHTCSSTQKGDVMSFESSLHKSTL